MRPIVDREHRARRAHSPEGGVRHGPMVERTGSRRAGSGDAPRGSTAWIRVGLVLAGVVVADQLSKHAVEHSIVPGEERKLLPGIALVNTRNHGVAFGFLPGSHLGVTILIAVALLALLVYFARHRAERLIWLPTGMLVGGALGNVLDRVRDGGVTDFIKLPLGWPPFNLADTSITLGILILFLLIDHARHVEP
jgi:signal peptidase II